MKRARIVFAGAVCLLLLANTSMAQAMRHNAAKYITRIHDTGQYMSGKAGLTPTGQQPPAALKQAAVRGPQTAAQAKAVAQQSRHCRIKPSAIWPVC